MNYSKIIRERLKEAHRRNKKPVGRFKKIDLSTRNHPNWMTRAYENNRFIVMIDDNVLTDKGYAIKALIQTLNDTPIRDHWREIQNIKNELFGHESVGIEYYPKESELIDDHNIYWLWIFPDGILPKMI